MHIPVGRKPWEWWKSGQGGLGSLMMSIPHKSEVYPLSTLSASALKQLDQSEAKNDENSVDCNQKLIKFGESH